MTIHFISVSFFTILCV
jgi:hypothetical protein